MGIVFVMSRLGWRVLVAFCLNAACTDWQSLYTPQVKLPGDAATLPDAPVVDPDAEPDAAVAPPDVEVDLGAIEVEPDDTAIAPAARDPVAFWRFDEMGRPSLQPIRDRAPREPDLPLQWDLNRDSGKTEGRDGMLVLDGGFLSAGIFASNALGRVLLAARSFTLELWIKATPTNSGTIFTTFTPAGDKTAGRAFAIIQKENLLHFSVHTSATDNTGERFPAVGSLPAASAEAHARLPPEVTPEMPIHVVAVYSDVEKSAVLYVDGEFAEAVNHHRAGTPPPTLVWSQGKYELGVGGAFDLMSAWRGAIYLAAIYDRVLAADEIKELYSAGPTRM
jgi:hypothetical protein